jgi:hypothetical protein
MSDLRKAAEMALEALEWKESYLRKLTWKHESVTDAAKALRQTLAQPKWVGLTDEDL